jgi:hypothetical protein
LKIERFSLISEFLDSTNDVSALLTTLGEAQKEDDHTNTLNAIGKLLITHL